jgi:hypothetical protein
MAHHEIDARICRWLLPARDLSGSDTLPFTQEFLAEMLGVERCKHGGAHSPGSAWSGTRAAKLKYATLKVDLREGGCESYETVEEQYNQLLRNLSCVIIPMCVPFGTFRFYDA